MMLESGGKSGVDGALTIILVIWRLTFTGLTRWDFNKRRALRQSIHVFPVGLDSGITYPKFPSNVRHCCI